MFCPQCKAEYREGFTRCGDCEVDLVTSLEEDRVQENPTELLWKGGDSLLFRKMVVAVRNAGLACHVKTAGPNLGLPMLEFEIRLFRSDLAAGRRLVATLLEDASTEPVEQREKEETSEEVEILLEPSDVPEEERHLDWDPGEAPELAEPNAEVWSGNDTAISNFVRTAFRENNIGYSTLVESPGREIILVRPQDKNRAREIVHEIVEGAPPA